MKEWPEFKISRFPNDTKIGERASRDSATGYQQGKCVGGNLVNGGKPGKCGELLDTLVRGIKKQIISVEEAANEVQNDQDVLMYVSHKVSKCSE